jgi:putative RecB family exonuclease
MRLSPTRINTYVTCPRKYRYRYVDRIPTILTGPLAFGRILHKVVLDLHLDASETQSDLDLNFALATFDQQWKQIQETEKPHFAENGTTPAGYADLAHRILYAYVQLNGRQQIPLLMEFSFELPAGEHSVTGIMDRVEEDTERLVLIDFKSGKRKPGAAALRDDIQLTFYAYAVTQIFGRQADRIIYYHLRDQSRLTTERTEADFNLLLFEIVPYVAESIRSGRFSPRYGWWCKACDFKERCDAEGPPPDQAVFAPVDTAEQS